MLYWSLTITQVKSVAQVITRDLLIHNQHFVFARVWLVRSHKLQDWGGMAWEYYKETASTHRFWVYMDVSWLWFSSVFTCRLAGCKLASHTLAVAARHTQAALKTYQFSYEKVIFACSHNSFYWTSVCNPRPFDVVAGAFKLHQKRRNSCLFCSKTVVQW